MRLKSGEFCELFGATARNKVLEYVISTQGEEFEIPDMAKWLGISKPKAYEVIRQQVKKGIVKKTRMHKNTQLYKLNKDNNRVKVLLKMLDECVNMIIEEKASKAKANTENIRVIATAKSH